MSTGEEYMSNVGAPFGNDNAVGNSGGGAPIGNTNAVGNTGGRAPEGNTNRKSHGVHCSLEKIDERAEGEMAEFIDQIESLIRDRVTEDPGPVAREIPLRIIRFDRAAQYIQQEGFGLDDETNPMLATSRRISARIFQDLQEIGAI